MKVELSLDKERYNLGDTIQAVVTITNTGPNPLRVPKPEFRLPSVSFHLVRPPETTDRESYLVRVGPEGEDLPLEPGQSLSGTIELLAVEAGRFALACWYGHKGPLHPQFVGTNATHSNAVELHVDAPSPEAGIKARLSTEAGDVVLRFFPERAHNHVLSFLQLANKGYFDGRSFHRVVPNFVIQGGCPLGNGTGGPGYRLPAEFNEIPHQPGILSMARTADPHSAGSQFFLCTARASHLDNQYTVFGEVESGLEAVMEIGEDSDNAGRFHMKTVEVFVE